MPSRIGEYVITKTLGAGVTSKVKLATDPQGGVWAIKIFDKANPNVTSSLIKALRAEVETLKNLQHPNIVNMKDYNENGVWEKSSGNKDIAYIVLELISGGELFDFIATGGALPENICRYYFRQILSALHYLHSQGVCHRDLKPENLLVDKNFNVRIADFGFAAPIEGRDGSGVLHTKLGTESYMAPEIHNKKPFQGQTVDLFASAIILFIMLTGHPPFSQAVPQDRFYKFISGNRADVFWRSHARNKSGGFSKEFTEMLTCMLQLIPSQRLTMADVVGHPWMKGEIATEEMVHAEFATRHDKILAEAKAEEMRKQQIRAQRMQATGGAHRGVNDKVVMMGVGDEQKGEQSISTKLLGTYNAGAHKNTEFFSHYAPNLIFDDIHALLLQNENVDNDQIMIDEKKYKMCFNIQAKKNVLPLEEELEEGEEVKEQESEIPISTKINIKLLQAEEDKICVEFTCAGGSKQFFYDQYKQILGNESIDNLNDC